MQFTSPETQQHIRQLLQNGNLLVTFTKANGDKRLLRCTLRADAIPQPTAKKAPSAAPTQGAAQAVWDLDAGAWRSFRWDSVQEIEGIAPNAV